MSIPTQAQISSLPNAELGELIARAADAKRELNRRNAASNNLERVNARWRNDVRVEPLPAYDAFAFALAWQRQNQQKRNKKLARAVSLLVHRPELFLHLLERSPALKQVLEVSRGWTPEALPDEFKKWLGSRGKKAAEAEFERVDNKLRELTQQPNKAASCLRPKLRDLEQAYAA